MDGDQVVFAALDRGIGIARHPVGKRLVVRVVPVEAQLPHYFFQFLAAIQEVFEIDRHPGFEEGPDIGFLDVPRQTDDTVFAEPIQSMILAEPRARGSVEDLGGLIALARLQLVVSFQHVGVVQEPVHIAEDAEAIGDLLHRPPAVA